MVGSEVAMVGTEGSKVGMAAEEAMVGREDMVAVVVDTEEAMGVRMVDIRVGGEVEVVGDGTRGNVLLLPSA